MKNMWARAFNTEMNRARMEGVYSQQYSESFHGTLEKLKIKEETPAYAVSQIYSREIERTIKAEMKYHKILEEEHIFGPNITKAYDNTRGSILDYNLCKHVDTETSVYSVTSKMHHNDTHIVNLENKTCN